MAGKGLRYGQVVLTCSANSGGTSGGWFDCGRFRGGIFVQVANSSSDSGVSATVILQGALTATVGTATVITGTRGIRLGSLAVTAASLNEMTCLLLSTVAGNLTPGADSSILPRYLRCVIQTLEQGNPVLIVGGIVEDEKV